MEWIVRREEPTKSHPGGAHQFGAGRGASRCTGHRCVCFMDVLQSLRPPRIANAREEALLGVSLNLAG